MPIKVPVLPVDVPRLQSTLDFRAAVNNSVSGGSLGVFPLFGLLAEFSQIDDVAHLALFTAPVEETIFRRRPRTLRNHPPSHPRWREYMWQSDGIFFLFARHGSLNTY